VVRTIVRLPWPSCKPACSSSSRELVALAVPWRWSSRERAGAAQVGVSGCPVSVLGVEGFAPVAL